MDWIDDLLPLVACSLSVLDKKTGTFRTLFKKLKQTKHTYKTPPNNGRNLKQTNPNMIKSRTVCSQMFVFVEVIMSLVAYKCPESWLQKTFPAVKTFSH